MNSSAWPEHAMLLLTDRWPASFGLLLANNINSVEMLPPEIDSHLLDKLVIVVSLIAAEQLRRSTIDPLHWHSSSDRLLFVLSSDALAAPSNTHKGMLVSVKSVNAAMQHFLYEEAHILFEHFFNSSNKNTKMRQPNSTGQANLGLCFVMKSASTEMLSHSTSRSLSTHPQELCLKQPRNSFQYLNLGIQQKPTIHLKRAYHQIPNECPGCLNALPNHLMKTQSRLIHSECLSSECSGAGSLCSCKE
ncbi:uncharacterized protein MONOS_4667 [Monocercomonoides exilis]|uniref:uncharacterized protein n=1 Tax=Monocercomonoides exilis TaxID=2049356 RepID=UPI00355ABF03|nr:hypothetical protein MONOS_4667 [Monocercomonoides exilis]|eukprot:MONOS_4667.1-p1 / transcript=MONOS_4667.1 / gene=MONOS_4667 / organism=Monocercomonoides_exilis_PA203 / gene_product=unspecified product / transcript_product=unspecified product / location=Mono_scaffold00126:80490-81230(-) / protein_length=247 / sequence_SO=supercontig / SO=protein_coding / is_pseudo=false